MLVLEKIKNLWNANFFFLRKRQGGEILKATIFLQTLYLKI